METHVRNVVIVRKEPGIFLALVHENVVLHYEGVSWRQGPVEGAHVEPRTQANQKRKNEEAAGKTSTQNPPGKGELCVE